MPQTLSRSFVNLRTNLLFHFFRLRGGKTFLFLFMVVDAITKNMEHKQQQKKKLIDFNSDNFTQYKMHICAHMASRLGCVFFCGAENSCEQRSGVKVTNAVLHKIFNKLPASCYHFLSLCLLILMPYHLYFPMFWLFFLFFFLLHTRQYFPPLGKVMQPDIAIEWIGKERFFHNLSLNGIRNNFESFRRPNLLIISISSIYHSLFVPSSSPLMYFQLIYSPPEKLLLNKIGFLFCGNYPFAAKHNPIHFENQNTNTYFNTKQKMNWKWSTSPFDAHLSLIIV